MTITLTDVKPAAVGAGYGPPPAQTEKPKKPGRPSGSTGNGKTHQEKVERLNRARELFQLDLDAKAEASRQEFASLVQERKRAQESHSLDVYEAQESRRAQQFQIDQTPTLVLLGVLAAVTFITTAILTADGTIGSSIAARFAIEWFGYVLFGAFEIAILAFMLMYYVQGSRIDIVTGERLKADHWFQAMIAVSAITVLLSAYHVLDVYGYAWTDIDMWVGIGIRLAVSVIFVIVAKGIASVLFAKAIDLNELTRG